MKNYLGSDNMTKIDIRTKLLDLFMKWSPNGGLLGLDWGIDYEIDYDDTYWEENNAHFELYAIENESPMRTIDEDKLTEGVLRVLREAYKEDPAIKVGKHYGDTVEIWRE